MLVYILSNVNQTLGVFSTPLEAQKYYSTLYRSNDQLFPIKLEEFTLNGTSGKDMTLFLKQEPSLYYHNKQQERKTKIVLGPENVLRIRKQDEPNRSRYFEPRPVFDLEYDECYNCGGEDCRDGCVNDNYDF
jgi:hypothetical protein